MQNLNLNKKEETHMKATNKTMKRARLIVMALLALGALSVGAHPQPTSAIADPVIPVTACGTILDVEGGQYILTGDLNCVGTGGVGIRANDIHFNLNGFTISGSGVGSGIVVANFVGAGLGGVHINGGTVTGFITGIAMRNAGFCHVNGMTVTGNVTGICLCSNASLNIINGNTVNGNGDGIVVVDFNSVENFIKGNTALGNTNFDLSDPCLCGGCNQWTGNTFETDNETGADFGPGAGCIQ
jgi:hypothetical protein